MLRTLPGLEGIRISHAWSGRIGVSRDHFPHIGNVEGVHYAMGYSGTGVTRSTYFGNKVALKLLGDPDGATEFDDIPFRSHGPPARMPFVVNAVVRWMTLLDRVDALRTSTGPS
jgi:glycine/D-amino acid oxidase-like deaminating enzyme